MLDFPEGPVHVADSSFTIERLSLHPKRDTHSGEEDRRTTDGERCLPLSLEGALCPLSELV